MNKKILIVDDSDLVAQMLQSMLESNGFETVRAANGVEAIEKVYSEIPHLIIMDVDMPLLRGYQASRLIKSRRGIQDIPIIIHTSYDGDKEKYWAVSSGADDFITKDFDNMDRIVEKITFFTQSNSIDRTIIKEDAKSIDRHIIFEMIGELYDRELFHSTILNSIGHIGRSIKSLDNTIYDLLKLLDIVCETHIAVILLNVQKKVHAYILPSNNITEGESKDFINICLNDFHTLFPDFNLDKIEETYFDIEKITNFKSKKNDPNKISSYEHFSIYGNGPSLIGSLHLGNISNNYFSTAILQNIYNYSEGAGIIIENALLFHNIYTMKNKIKNVFAKFVPREIINDLVEKESVNKLMVGEKRDVVILFSDIRSFTTITEHNNAENVVAFLNRYFEIMGDIIIKYGGTIDKFIGDAILAIFGAPKSYKDNAVRAFMAAAQMIQTLKKVRIKNLQIPKKELRIGIGLHEGSVIVGNIGSKDKFDYTVIGDSVNLAARLEGLTKHYKQDILVSESIKQKVENIVPLREVDTVKVKGKSESTCLYAIDYFGERPDEEYTAHYNNGIKLYKMGNFSTALDYFNKALELKSDDNLSMMFIERCENFIKNPPENWDGAIALDFK